MSAGLFHALGNHDLEVTDDKKEQVLKRLGLERGYYSFADNGKIREYQDEAVYQLSVRHRRRR